MESKVEIYLVKSEKVSLGDPQFMYRSWSRKTRQCSVIPKPRPIGALNGDLSPQQTNPCSMLFETATRFLALKSFTTPTGLTLEFTNMYGKTGQDKDKMQVKIGGEILFHLHSLFGYRMRLSLEIANATINRDFLDAEIWEYLRIPPPMFGGDAALLRPPQDNPLYEMPVVGRYRPYGNSAHHDSKIAEDVVKDMKIVFEPGVAAHFIDEMTCPSVWHRYWNELRNGVAANFGAEISIILSICGEPEKLKRDAVAEMNRRLLIGEIKTDLEIVAWNEEVVKCYSGFLVAQSEVFRGMLDSGMTEATTKRIRMDDMSVAGIKALLAYIYYNGLGGVLDSCAVAVEVLQAARKYLIQSLEDQVKGILMYKPIEWFDVDAALGLYFFSDKVDHFQELKGKSVTVLKSMREQLKTCELYCKLSRENPEVAKEIDNIILETV